MGNDDRRGGAYRGGGGVYLRGGGAYHSALTAFSRAESDAIPWELMDFLFVVVVCRIRCKAGFRSDPRLVFIDPVAKEHQSHVACHSRRVTE